MCFISEVTFVPVSKVTGQAEVEDVLSAVRPTTCLVTIMLANNETGVIMVSQLLSLQGGPREEGISVCPLGLFFFHPFHLWLCFALGSSCHLFCPHPIGDNHPPTPLLASLPTSACP